MRITKNVRIQFSFGEDDEDTEDTYDIDLQISWEASNPTETEIKTSLDEVVRKWIRENVSYTWEEVEVEEDDP
ncbi:MULTISPECIES: hypothetical protein [Paenibacillus]|uniref:Uncharacterized protein n=2 Tax=Paenibacillus TaxID=44249 RepID=A0A920CI96_9BACL|nr:MULTISPECIES: hypothetical protein [Paenibacillus]GGG15335.1 hypothetical protein GCM10010913_41550 [Paenibacillus aceti]GIO38064.1 hypothetical protein J41TS12_29250 [Paenibacillus antibioticophila]SDX28816.1 hypothetical protein SAMN05518848_10622 [Paenibacillus sp. PDC88]